mmetsp:Transcript_5028/g.12664  ORF Transcript_5028/g.12664 Transcript_5028/m.12664 type:complete len:264 (-) Transcript_5028:2839-3630(-)
MVLQLLVHMKITCHRCCTRGSTNIFTSATGFPRFAHGSVRVRGRRSRCSTTIVGPVQDPERLRRRRRHLVFSALVPGTRFHPIETPVFIRVSMPSARIATTITTLRSAQEIHRAVFRRDPCLKGRSRLPSCVRLRLAGPRRDVELLPVLVTVLQRLVQEVQLVLRHLGLSFLRHQRRGSAWRSHSLSGQSVAVQRRLRGCRRGSSADLVCVGGVDPAELRQVLQQVELLQLRQWVQTRCSRPGPHQWIGGEKVHRHGSRKGSA